jgi:hypothetical protein
MAAGPTSPSWPRRTANVLRKTESGVALYPRLHTGLHPGLHTGLDARLHSGLHPGLDPRSDGRIEARIGSIRRAGNDGFLGGIQAIDQRFLLDGHGALLSFFDFSSTARSCYSTVASKLHGSRVPEGSS